ncbi:lipoprotein [Streptomyces viridochromogenes]|uniref:Lipoprotein n=1 Tax=Streptomyces viridochromogenes TaxID=1938 RepID=A0A0J7ZLT0_STRVR|nr:hypothetical protein [Streptomyces viridochromogenes]KMS76879.1 lipoprotein [Streptomyces viridochromogenes]KOG22042.1 lipoprotein [Streptomyces viridochromogenes]KOG29949.1 lipoprotein [Streptomyces viridochromogenes]
MQAHRGRTGRVGRVATATGSLALLLLATACGGGEGKEGSAAKSSPTNVSATAAGVVAPAKVEVLADLTGCKVRIRTEADELREGVCRTKRGDYLITTFPQEKLKLTWLDAAAVYGGKYLVGTRWVVSAKPELLEQLRPQLGGKIEQLRGVGPAPGPSAS